MIENFRDGQSGSLAQFYRNKKRSKDILATIESALARKLDIIEYATTERSLFAPQAIITNAYRVRWQDGQVFGSIFNGG